MSQQSRVPHRPTIERLIQFLRGQPQPPRVAPSPAPASPKPSTPPALPPPPESRSLPVTSTLSHAEVASEPPIPSTRVLVERIVNHLRATGPLDSSIVMPPPIKPISHAPFYDGTPTSEHEYPTHPVRPERLVRTVASRPIVVSTLKNPEWFPEGGQLLLRAISGQPLGTVTLARDVLLGRADTKPDVQLRAERINLSALVPDTSSISRIHAMLRLTDNRRVQVVDMGSTNGTYLNHHRLDSFKPAMIKDGDEIQLGIFRLRVHFVHP
ncbi:MAG: FHA domain-containing protein [Anaerolineae bacterium]|nr:FHA domain-containing protein [Anaerolineae bacterium]